MVFPDGGFQMFRTVAFVAVLALSALCRSGAAAQDFFAEDEILRVSPRASAPLVQALVDNQAMLAARDIDTRLRVSHFLAQIMTETGGLRRLDENMNYSATRLTQVFSRRVVTPAKAAALAGQPEAIANWIYRNRLGNGGPETGDGWAYRGSGYIQLTGRTNYRLRGEEIGLPLEGQPDLARQPGPGLEAAAAYWAARRINVPADLNDRRGIRRLVNGPRMEGLDQAILWHNRIWSGIYRDRDPFPNEAAAIETAQIEDELDARMALDRILVEEGFAESGALESGGEEAAAQALREYQESRGLEPTGVLDDDTFYAITDPAEWRNAEDTEMAAAAPFDGDADQGIRHDLAGAAASSPENAPPDRTCVRRDGDSGGRVRHGDRGGDAVRPDPGGQQRRPRCAVALVHRRRIQRCAAASVRQASTPDAAQCDAGPVDHHQPDLDARALSGIGTLARQHFWRERGEIPVAGRGSWRLAGLDASAASPGAVAAAAAASDH